MQKARMVEHAGLCIGHDDQKIAAFGSSYI
jgi:hypothetical protein